MKRKTISRVNWLWQHGSALLNCDEFGKQQQQQQQQEQSWLIEILSASWLRRGREMWSVWIGMDENGIERKLVHRGTPPTSQLSNCWQNKEANGREWNRFLHFAKPKKGLLMIELSFLLVCSLSQQFPQIAMWCSRAKYTGNSRTVPTNFKKMSFLILIAPFSCKFQYFLTFLGRQMNVSVFLFPQSSPCLSAISSSSSSSLSPTEFSF